MTNRSDRGLLGLARRKTPHPTSGPRLSPAAAFDSAPWGVLMLDEQRLVSYANRQALTVLGLAADEAIGRPVTELLSERTTDDRGSLEETLSRSERGAFWLMSPAGHRRFEFTLIPWEDGESRGHLLHLVDDTARYQAEEDRRASEASLLTFLTRSPEPAVVHAGGVVLYANQAVTEALGYASADELVGKSLLELTHPDDRGAVQERVAHMLRTHEPLPVREERFLRRDGSTFHAEVFALPVMLESRIVFLAWGRDLSERRRADEERQRLLAERTRLMEDAQRHASELEAILDNMLTGVIVCDTGGRVTLANEVGAHILARESAKTLVDMTLEDLAAEYDCRRPDGTPLTVPELALSRAMKGETIGAQDCRITLDDGARERYLRSSAGPIRNARGEVVAAVQVFRDHTDVVEFNRLKDQFMRVVAHELKTPLAIMQGYTELLERNPDAARRLDTVGALRRGASRIERLVGDMASLSGVLARDLPLALAPLQLDVLVQRLVDSMARTHRNRDFSLDLKPLTVLADEAQLEQVIQRLLDNAVRYSPEGGPVIVRLEQRGEMARLSVTDRGVGIPKDKQARIFQRFYRAHTDTPYDYGGLGIGLSLSREIVNMHRGRMGFESTEGVGSSFHLELPVTAREE